MDEVVVDTIITTKIIIITTTIIIQPQIGSWVNWSWTSGRATEALPPSSPLDIISDSDNSQTTFVSHLGILDNHSMRLYHSSWSPLSILK